MLVARVRRLERRMEQHEYAHLARELGVKVIHCSERDTQRASRPKRPDEFVATWSVEGMWVESISPSELGWGTHEKWGPPFPTRPETGPDNQIILSQMGLNTWVRSWMAAVLPQEGLPKETRQSVVADLRRKGFRFHQKSRRIQAEAPASAREHSDLGLLTDSSSRRSM